MSFKPFLALAAALSLTACDWLTRPIFRDKDSGADASVAASAVADDAMSDAVVSNGPAEDDEDESWVEDVSLPADTTPPPTSRNFTKETTVFHRKSPYFEVSLKFQGDFRPYPDAFSTLYRVNHDDLDSELQTYGGRDGQSDSAETTVTLDAVSPRLLVVSTFDWSYTGGAHGNGGSGYLIWDRKAKALLKPEEVFLPGDIPEAENYACKQFLKQFEMTDPKLAGCGYQFTSRDFSGAVARNGRITGVVVASWPFYAAGWSCAVVPYRLFKAFVKPEWKDQFADDPDFEAHNKDRCTDA